MKLIVSPGTVVADRFTIRRFIAEGGMGEVYEAHDMLLDENIAVKFLSRRNIGDEAVTRRFQREIQLARKVTHPNVCRLFDVYQTPLAMTGFAATLPVTFVTMELLHGETLEDFLQEKGAMSEQEALPLAVQMCQALTAAHDAGIIHRDFKSNNVMLEPTDDGVRVVVTDFGLARSILPNDPSRTPLTADQLILGTAEYMAPEQIKGEPVSLKSDLYAFGVVLFELVTGRKPYSAANPMQLLVKRVSEPPARPRDFAPNLSESWDAVINECLAESPDDRPESAEEVIERLGGVTLRSVSRTAIEAPPPEALAQPRSSWNSPAFWLGLAAFLLATVAFLASRQTAPSLTLGTFKPARLTTGTGLEFDASFSPDGLKAVYSVERSDGSFGLYVQDLSSTDPPRELKVGGGQAFEPAWEPAGPRILYTSRKPGGLWLTTEDGTEPERLVEQGARASWSPDGRRIAFQTEASPLLSDTTVPAMSPSVIAVLDLESGELTRVTKPSAPPGGHAAPTWAPNGRHLVFNTHLRSDGELWAVDLESGELTPLLVEPARAFDPVVSADGRSVFFSFLSREVKSLWRLEVDPKTLRPVGEPEEIAGVGLSSIRQPTFSRDGRHLLYAAYITRSNLWRLDLDDRGLPRGAPRALTTGNDRYNRPAFAADGRTLVYDHWTLGVDIDLYTKPIEGGGQRQITTGEGTNSHGSWLPDGRLAYTATATEGRKTLRLTDPATGDDEQLLELEADADWITLSPLGDRMAFHSPRGGQGLDIWIQEIDDLSPWRLTFHEQSAAFPAWSTDGRHLAYQVRMGDGTHLWLAPLDGGEPRVLVKEPLHNWPYGFSPDSQKVLYAGLRNGTWNLFWLDLEDGTTLQLTQNQAVTGYLRYPTWSPDGLSIVYEKAETTSDLFLVRNYLTP